MLFMNGRLTSLKPYPQSVTHTHKWMFLRTSLMKAAEACIVFVVVVVLGFSFKS